jgi:hypothetical protein
VGATLLTLAPSASLAARLRALFTPKKFRGREAFEEDDSNFESSLYVCVSVYDSCVVAFDTSWGLGGAIPCDVDGLESRSSKFFGRGGSGGGVPSLDTAVRLLKDDFRDALRMMLSVGFVKSCCSTLSLFWGVLACAPGTFSGAEPGDWGPALPVSSIEEMLSAWHGHSFHE